MGNNSGRAEELLARLPRRYLTTSSMLDVVDGATEAFMRWLKAVAPRLYMDGPSPEVRTAVSQVLFNRNSMSDSHKAIRRAGGVDVGLAVPSEIDAETRVFVGLAPLVGHLDWRRLAQTSPLRKRLEAWLNVFFILDDYISDNENGRNGSEFGILGEACDRARRRKLAEMLQDQHAAMNPDVANIVTSYTASLGRRRSKKWRRYRRRSAATRRRR